MQTVCVFCGSNLGVDARFLETACALGAALASSGRTLVYGGAKVGLMGAVADAALAGGGKVIGVLPQALVEREVAHGGLTELHIVSGMHERKKMMAGLADAFITLPGGLGTLEELFEVWTWASLGLHQKPLGLLGPKDFFAPLLQYLDQLVVQGFVQRSRRESIALEEQPEPLLEWLERHEPAAPKWLDGTIT